MRIILAFVFGLLAVRACAQQIGPEDVLPREVIDEISQCIRSAGETGQAIACLNRPDVPPDARTMGRQIAADTDFGMVALLTGFDETGDVDLAQVFFPLLANTNYQTVLVNGAAGPQMAADLNFRRVPPNMPGTRAILSRHPRAFESGRVGVTAVRPLPDGGQLFVLSDVVTDGCRACPVVANSIRYFTFRDGVRYGFERVGWQPAIDMLQGDYYRAVLRGNGTLLQARLNELGYNAGVVDGAVGPRTRAALEAFRRDYCLPAGGAIRREDVDVLAFTDQVYGDAHCAPGRNAGPLDWPLVDGVYTLDDRLCPPVAEETWIEFGDGAYGSSVLIEGHIWGAFHANCAIRGVTPLPTPGAAEVALTCSTEGEETFGTIELEDMSSTGFTNNGERFRLCAPETETPANGAPADPSLSDAAPLFPVSGPEVRITANFGAFGPGPASDPNAYFEGQLHAATDFAVLPGRIVVAPVAGDIVYYHTRSNASPTASGLQTFLVFRDETGRDWIFGHVECTLCADHPPVGDLETWPGSHVVRDIERGTPIGRIIDLESEGFGNHLHLGLLTRPIVAEGQLLAPYRYGHWARLTYDEGTEGAANAARALAETLGFIDPMNVLTLP